MASIAPALTPGVSAQTLALAFGELAAMASAGLPLDHALEQAGHTGPWHFRQALEALAQYVRAGHPLSEGIRSYGALFHPMIPALIAAGESSGNIDASFRLLSDFFESEAQLRRTLQSALIMPAITVVVAIGVVTLLSIIKIPIGNHVESFVPFTWAARLIWLCAICVGLWFALRFRTVQAAARYVVMVIPFFGGLMQQLAVARFCQTFGLLIRAGVPYLEALPATLSVTQHPIVDRAVQHIYAGVRNGVPVEQSIRSSAAFPRVVTALVGAGEVSGNLDESLLKAAKYLREDAEHKVKNSAKLAGPVMTIVLGAIVLLILLQFWGQYFHMLNSIGDD